MAPGTVDPDDPLTALREARSRFVAGFNAQCDSIGALLAGPALADVAASAALRQLVHRMTGLAGTVGFPTVSRRAGELEAVLSQNEWNTTLANDLLGGIREAFAFDLMSAPAGLGPPDTAAHGSLIAIVEDDPDQLSVLEIHLETAGLRTVGITSGFDAVSKIEELRPAVVLLEVDLPGLDGYTICRTLKSMPALAATPVVFLTTKASINERLSGLTLGADEYLSKPIDPRELLVRIRHLISKAPANPAAAAGAELAFDPFSEIASAHFAKDTASLALIRVPPAQRATIIALLTEESRRRDVICRYDDGHLIWLLPGTARPQALERARNAVERIRAEGHAGVTAGVAAGGKGASLKDVVAEADEALAEARYLKAPAAARGNRAAAPATAVSHSVVLADDDPEVMRIVDAHMKAAGFRTTIAFDGAKALQAIRDQQPDVVVLDLMMPVMTGFEVLKQLRDLSPRPRIVVLSARGREDDVTRAFEMGADDYIVKPFSPQELRARILRLLR